MPKELEHKLMMEAAKKGLGKKRSGAYVYGTMAKIMKRKHEKMERGGSHG